MEFYFLPESWIPSAAHPGEEIFSNSASFELVVFLVACRVTGRLLGEVALHGLFKVDTCLICEANDDKKYIG